MRSAIVTGAAAGIGRAVALALAARGWGLVLADRDAAGMADVAAAAPDAITLPCDLASDAAIEQLVALAGKDAPLVAVVHCAALFPRIALADTHMDDVDRVLAVNLRAAIALTLLAPPAMAAGGTLVFLTSGSGLMSAAQDPFQRGFALYGASKAALDRWVAGVAPELLERGIAASTITPGAFVATPGLARTGAQPPPGAATIGAERVAQAVVRLAEDRTGAFSGQRLSAAAFGSEWR